MDAGILVEAEVGRLAIGKKAWKCCMPCNYLWRLLCLWTMQTIKTDLGAGGGPPCRDTWMPRIGIFMDLMTKFIFVLFRNEPELWRTFRRRRILSVLEINLSYNVPLDWCDKQVFRNNVLLYAGVIVSLVQSWQSISFCILGPGSVSDCEAKSGEE